MKIRLCLATVLVALVAGCGGGDDGGGGGGSQPSAGGGEKVFTDNCSSCHTLAAAGASGKVGPNLDQLKPSANLVTTQVTNGGGGMPAFKGKLSEDQIKQVADYVSSNAGKGS